MKHLLLSGFLSALAASFSSCAQSPLQGYGLYLGLPVDHHGPSVHELPGIRRAATSGMPLGAGIVDVQSLAGSGGDVVVVTWTPPYSGFPGYTILDRTTNSWQARGGLYVCGGASTFLLFQSLAAAASGGQDPVPAVAVLRFPGAVLFRPSAVGSDCELPPLADLGEGCRVCEQPSPVWREETERAEHPLLPSVRSLLHFAVAAGGRDFELLAREFEWEVIVGAYEDVVRGEVDRALRVPELASEAFASASP